VNQRKREGEMMRVEWEMVEVNLVLNERYIHPPLSHPIFLPFILSLSSLYFQRRTSSTVSEEEERMSRNRAPPIKEKEEMEVKDE
jgi:hypothetical protein